MPLTREQILAAVDLPPEPVSVPEWGGDVLVRGLDAGEAIEVAELAKAQPVEILLAIAERGVVDESGAHLFDAAGVRALLKKGIRPLKRVSERICELSGMAALGKTEADAGK